MNVDQHEALRSPIAEPDSALFPRFKDKLLAPILCSILLVAILLLVFKVLPPKYEASMVIGPSNGDNKGTGALSRLAGSLSSVNGLDLQSLAGGALDSGASSQMERLLEVMRTPALGEILERDNGILKLMFDRQWDAERAQWRRPAGKLAGFRRFVSAQLLNRPGWRPPGIEEYADYMNSRMDVLSIRKTGLYQVSITERTPEKALQILTLTFQGADDLLRQKFISRHQEMVDYLAQRIPLEQDVTLRQALTSVLLNEEQVLTLAQASRTFAADVIQPPVVDWRPKGPPAVQLLLLAVALGIGLGLLVNRNRRKRREARLAAPSVPV